MNYKILLINPISSDKKTYIRIGRCQTQAQPGIECWPPVDLALIGTALKKINNVSNVVLYDAQRENNYKKMYPYIKNEAPQIVILNCTTPTVFSDIEVAEQIKKDNKECLIIFFGLHATARPLDIMKSSFVDCCVRGEPEDTISLVVRDYIEKGKRDFGSIYNIVYLSKENEIIETKRKEVKSSDFIHLIPDRSLIDNQYYKLMYNNKPFTIIQTSRGCLNNCIYCTASMYSAHYSCRSVESVLEEIKECIKKYEIRDFLFLSDTFTANRKWVEEFCNKLIFEKIQIRWMSNSRIDKIDYSLAKLMKESGCWIVSLGIESYDENILRRAKKNINRHQIVQTVNILYSVKIKTIGYFMFGLPGESKESIGNTIKFSLSLPLDYAYFYHTTPFPGTVLFEIAKKNHWLLTVDWTQYAHGKKVLLAYDGLSVKDVERAVRKAYCKFYFRPRQVINQLSTIHSIRVLFNNLKAMFNLLSK